jgi:hypothetical protein
VRLGAHPAAGRSVWVERGAAEGPALIILCINTSEAR